MIWYALAAAVVLVIAVIAVRRIRRRLESRPYVRGFTSAEDQKLLKDLPGRVQAFSGESPAIHGPTNISVRRQVTEWAVCAKMGDIAFTLVQILGPHSRKHTTQADAYWLLLQRFKEGKSVHRETERFERLYRYRPCDKTYEALDSFFSYASAIEDRGRPVAPQTIADPHRATFAEPATAEAPPAAPEPSP